MVRREVAVKVLFFSFVFAPRRKQGRHGLCTFTYLHCWIKLVKSTHFQIEKTLILKASFVVDKFHFSSSLFVYFHLFSPFILLFLRNFISSMKRQCRFDWEEMSVQWRSFLWLSHRRSQHCALVVDSDHGSGRPILAL